MRLIKYAYAIVLVCGVSTNVLAAQDAGSGPTTGATSKDDAGSGPTQGAKSNVDFPGQDRVSSPRRRERSHHGLYLGQRRG